MSKSNLKRICTLNTRKRTYFIDDVSLKLVWYVGHACMAEHQGVWLNFRVPRKGDTRLRFSKLRPNFCAWLFVQSPQSKYNVSFPDEKSFWPMFGWQLWYKNDSVSTIREPFFQTRRACRRKWKERQACGACCFFSSRRSWKVSGLSLFLLDFWPLFTSLTAFNR